MLNYAVLSKKPSIFKNFSGLEVCEFDALNLKIEEIPRIRAETAFKNRPKTSSRRRTPLQPLAKKQSSHAATVLSPLRIINLARVRC